ncbi:uncharacterized protein LOC133290514 [Gastrolobium bilobum]|uniref:uncharacterized protein LOC133290514 n=1 Tax=Gastrolobium bilobum TaxID=150636 RepID=UPI002AAF64FB|nr:uncharacterized protein LOC133290514 [Gastrolobium bilobum]
MAGEARSLVEVLGGVEQHLTVENESNSEKPKTLVTLDLLGGSSSIETKELDFDLNEPIGWEKRLDLKSGKLHIQRRNTLGSPSVSEHKLRMNKAGPKHQGLNLTPSSKVPLDLFEETCLDLKLVSSSLSSSNYLSVFDNVNSALEREEKEEKRKRKSSSLPSPSSSCSSPVGENQVEECQDKLLSSPTLIPAGCSRCLMYVFIMKNNPKCPRCDSVVTFPFIKKPRFDLNI